MMSLFGTATGNHAATVTDIAPRFLRAGRIVTSTFCPSAVVWWTQPRNSHTASSRSPAKAWRQDVFQF
jgi:hypothetical protein